MSNQSVTNMSSFADDKPKPQGEGLPRRATKEPLPTVSAYGAEVDGLFQLFARSAKLYPRNNCLGRRPVGADGSLGEFQYESYETVHARVLTLGSGLAELGLVAGDAFGIYGANTPEWAQANLAGFSRGMVSVPIYDTLGDNVVQYEANHADMKLMFVQKKSLAGVLNVLPECPTLKHIVLLDGAAADAADAKATCDAAGVTLLDFQRLAASGAQKPHEPAPASGEQLAYIMYTSGTTGDPKGVCLSQHAITCGASYGAGLTLLPTDRYLSYLPLAHIFETVVEYGLFAVGGAVGFYSGNVRLLMDDIAALKPTIFVGVPRIFQRVYDKAYAGISSKKPAVANFLLRKLQKEIEAVRVGKHTMWNAVFKKIFRKVMGGHVRLMISGAAPLPSHVHEFLLATMGCPVIQGYGMTENCANATIQGLTDHTLNVGGPMPTAEVKLVDVSEMNYTSDQQLPTGEVCVRGPVVFSGYHKNQQATDETLIDGWLHTGDIGRWNADGTLSIIDRKKNIFKLAQGEYVAAEKIEMAISKSKFIGQPWVYGNSFTTMLVAVVVPDFEALLPHATANGWDVSSKEALVALPECRQLILDEIALMAKEAKLRGFEVPKAILLEGAVNELGQGYSIENDCLTPTFKLKRPALLRRYQAQVDEMYTSLGEGNVAKNAAPAAPVPVTEVQAANAAQAA